MFFDSLYWIVSLLLLYSHKPRTHPVLWVNILSMIVLLLLTCEMTQTKRRRSPFPLPVGIGKVEFLHQQALMHSLFFGWEKLKFPVSATVLFSTSQNHPFIGHSAFSLVLVDIVSVTSNVLETIRLTWTAWPLQRLLWFCYGLCGRVCVCVRVHTCVQWITRHDCGLNFGRICQRLSVSVPPFPPSCSWYPDSSFHTVCSHSHWSP